MTIEANTDREKIFLERLYQFLNSEKCTRMSLDELESIRVSKLQDGQGGRFEGNSVLINSKDLKVAMESVGEQRFDSYKDFSELLEHNKDVQFVANNLLHELYHCDMKKKMPTLHKMLAVENSNEETEWKGAISHFWIELYVEYCSHTDSLYQDESLLYQIAEQDFDIKYFWSDNNKKSMYRLIYLAQYFVALNLVYDTSDIFLPMVSDLKIRKLYAELIKVSKEKIGMNRAIDDYSELEVFEKLFRDYYSSLNIVAFSDE